MAKTSALDSLQDVTAVSREEWRKWLQKNHDKSEGVWLIIHNKGNPEPSVSYGEAVEEALCFGWIDSVPRKIDALKHKQLYTPRKPGSGWAKTNKERIDRLIKEGKMTEWGLQKIEAAKADGSWEMLDGPEAGEVPKDLTAALMKNKTAKENFEGYSPSVRKMILSWIAMAKRTETREKRIAETIEKASKGQKPV